LTNDTEQMNRSELQQVAWNTRETRISRNHSLVQMHEFLQYKEDVAPTPVNAKRDELIQFIQTNKNRLSLPCNGDCYQHVDGVVLFCHAALLEDNNYAEATKVDQEDAVRPGQS
tara:strand:- start:899 stop:1240 length:342 start_codon:yes stop_codon:yes gene_type:complete